MWNQLRVALAFGLLFAIGCATTAREPVEGPRDSVQPPLQVAKELEAAGKFEEAGEQYKLAMAVDPRNRAASEGRQRVRAQMDQHAITQMYFRAASELEGRGEWVEALRNFKLALTVDPGNHLAEAGRERVAASLRDSASHHYETGLRLRDEGKFDLARQEFLTALRHDPELSRALDALTARKRIRTKRHIVHTIQPGENLSQLAKIYYGDYRKFPAIAEYNNLPDATRVSVGQKIKIPELKGIELLGQKEAPSAVVEMPLEELEEPFSDLEKEAEEPIDQAVFYREHGIELYRQGKFQEAIIELDKSINAHPDDAVAVEYMYESRLQQGKKLLLNEDYLLAKKEFEQALRHNPTCQDCHSYIEKCENVYKDEHYKMGMQFFNEERLSQAITEWELVKALDPDYKRVGYLLNKANTIQAKLRQLQESRDRD